MSGQVVHILGSQEFDVYVGRSNARYGLQQSEFANPFKIGKDGTREEVLVRYEEALRQMCEKHFFYADEVLELRGKTLACWCSEKNEVLTTEDETVCHAQILLRLAEELAEEEQ